MLPLKHLRLIFQVFASGVFLFQMHHSLKKFMERPITQVKTLKSFDDVNKPVIYVCQENQYNYTRSKLHGYRLMTDFFMGNLNKTGNITWGGYQQNKTFQDLQKVLYTSDYSSFQALVTPTRKLKQLKNIEAIDVFVPVMGNCKKLKNIQNITRIMSNVQSMILLSDPALTSSIKIVEIENTKLVFGPTEKDFYESVYYEMDIEIHDTKVNEGISCTDYEDLGQTYGDCIEEALQAQLEDWYKCTPPWAISKINQNCEDFEGSILMNSSLIETIYNDLIPIFVG